VRTVRDRSGRRRRRRWVGTVVVHDDVVRSAVLSWRDHDHARARRIGARARRRERDRVRRRCGLLGDRRRRRGRRRLCGRRFAECARRARGHRGGWRSRSDWRAGRSLRCWQRTWAVTRRHMRSGRDGRRNGHLGRLGDRRRRRSDGYHRRHRFRSGLGCRRGRRNRRCGTGRGAFRLRQHDRRHVRHHVALRRSGGRLLRERRARKRAAKSKHYEGRAFH